LEGALGTVRVGADDSVGYGVGVISFGGTSTGGAGAGAGGDAGGGVVAGTHPLSRTSATSRNPTIPILHIV